jgi:hypothetical protein
LVTQRPGPEPAPYAAVDLDAAEELPQEFTLSIAGVDGEVYVVLGFGHLRWQFTPELAEDLARTLLDAARQVRQTNPDGTRKAPASTP